MSFTGFPAETFEFLRELSAHNDSGWFNQHWGEYERYYRDAAIDFVAALGPLLQELAPGLWYEPKVNGSVFRINRDIRFSRDKTPYKNHIDLWFPFGDRKGWDKPGFFFRMFAGELTLGAGMHSFNEAQLAAFREAVSDPVRGGEVSRIIAEMAQAGYPVGPFGKELKRPPKGYEAPPERAWMLLQSGILGMHQEPVPQAAHSPEFVDYCLERYTALWPLNRWLLDVLPIAAPPPQIASACPPASGSSQ